MAKVQLGDTVLYDQGSAQFPAIVTAVGENDIIRCTVFTPIGQSYRMAAYSAERKIDSYMLRPVKEKK